MGSFVVDVSVGVYLFYTVTDMACTCASVVVLRDNQSAGIRRNYLRRSEEMSIRGPIISSSLSLGEGFNPSSPESDCHW